MTPNMESAALAYASRFGWAVLPLHSITDGHCTCSEGAACKSAGKHPRTEHGLRDATTDPETIRRWWQRWPSANVGIATGSRSGFVAVDIDPRNGGDISLEQIEREHGSFPHTVEALTGGGGRHLLFSISELTPTSHDAERPGIDLQGDGSYIVAAPSLHLSGKRYEWESSSRPGEVTLEPLNGFFQTTIKKGPAAPLPEVIREGERNNTLTSIAGSMRRRGASSEGILEFLRVENRQRCQPPLVDAELESIARNVSRYDPAPTTTPKPQEAPARTLPAEYDLRQWRTAKPPEYHVDGIVPRSGLSTISGPAGVGKSFLTLDLACRLAIGCGENWLGSFKTTHRPQRVLLVDYENGGARLAWRLRCLQNGGAFTAFEIDEAIGNIVVFDRMPPGHDLVFSGVFGAWIKQTGATVAIVDPLRAIVARGSDNNDPLARAAMLFELRAQLLESEVAAVLVDHDSKSGMPNSGTMATQDHADACWHLTQPRENDHDHLQLASLKPRDGRAGKVAFRRVREGGGIRFEPAEVFAPEAELQRQIVSRLKNGPMRQADLIAGLGSRTTVLEALDELRSGGSAGTVVTTGARVNRSPVLALQPSTNEVTEVPE